MTSNKSAASVTAIPLVDPDGAPTSLGAFGGDPLVVILVRYFGCLPCQDYVREVDRRLDRFPEGSRVIAVGGSADYQARWLRDAKNVGMPLLLDGEQQVRSVAGVGDLTARQMSSIGGATNYVKSLLHGFRPQTPTADAKRAPGIVVFGAGFDVKWVHRGEMLGDYPPIEALIDRASSLARSV
jgi:peroxiredoxin